AVFLDSYFLVVVSELVVVTQLSEVRSQTALLSGVRKSVIL
ncbi:MAG: hypothetical protein ACI9JY_003177, partial [Saprospiraceae bacterium]